MLSLTEIHTTIVNFFDNSPLNHIRELANMRIYESPLLGVAAVEDPLFLKLQEPDVIGPHHFTPGDWFPEAQTVISYFMPFSARIREANYSQGYPAKEWLFGFYEGAQCSKELSQLLVEKIKSTGEKAVAPSFDSRYFAKKDTSNWSERHVAYIAGLGTFGLGKSLITEKGCAGRFGSIVVSQRFASTPRKYTDIYEYCTNCGSCIPRCPVQAISEEGKKHSPCRVFVFKEVMGRYSPRYGCGKCQTTVPCEEVRP